MFLAAINPPKFQEFWGPEKCGPTATYFTIQLYNGRRVPLTLSPPPVDHDGSAAWGPTRLHPQGRSPFLTIPRDLKAGDSAFNDQDTKKMQRRKNMKPSCKEGLGRLKFSAIQLPTPWRQIETLTLACKFGRTKVFWVLGSQDKMGWVCLSMGQHLSTKLVGLVKST